MRRPRVLIGALIGALAGPALAAQGAPAGPLHLSFAEAVRRAAGTAPSVALAGLGLSEADARVRQSRAALLPSLTVGGDWVNRTYSSKSFGFSFPSVPGQPPLVPTLIGPFNNYDTRLTATETLFDVASVRRMHAAQAEADGSDAKRDEAVETAAQVAALAYLGAVRAEAALAARRADSSIAGELLGLAEAQMAAGVSAAIDVTRARTQVVATAGQVVVAANAVDRGHIELARALGLDPGTALALTDTLASSLGAADVPTDSAAAVARALGNRPDLKTELARGVAAERQRSALGAELFPRLSLEGDYGLNGPTEPAALSTRQLAVTVSIPLLDGWHRESARAEQDAIAQESAVRASDLRQQIAADVDGALLDLRSASVELGIAAERLRLADEELAEARQRFSAGVAGNVEVIDAQSALIQARDADIDARYAAAVARVALARAVGVARTLH